MEAGARCLEKLVNFYKMHLNVENVTRIQLFFQGKTIFVGFAKMRCSLNLDQFTSLDAHCT